MTEETANSLLASRVTLVPVVFPKYWILYVTSVGIRMEEDMSLPYGVETSMDLDSMSWLHD